LDAEFCLLGPLQVRARGAALPVLPGKQRALLATLLLHGNRRVSLDRLIEAIWGDRPPASALGTVRHYVKELRKQLAVIGETRIATMPGGYLLRVGPGELDLLVFEQLLAEAAQAAADSAWALACDRWRSAEKLWRGEALADVPSELLHATEVPRLTEMRLHGVESRIEAELRLGRHAEVIPGLRQLAAAHPLRERVHALLMLALYRDSQQAAAQAVFRDVRRVLIEELGTEPGAGLRQLQEQILVADPALDLPVPAQDGRAAPQAPARGPESAAVPRQLPAAVSHFTGRAAELDALTGLLGEAGEADTVVISALAGTGGVGKTALAVHWAHRVAGRFPDGQLYVNLRGYDPREPVTAADALTGFLRALAVPGQQIPDDIEDRARLYRSMLAGRRLLIVLDNARDAGQARPLLPGGPGCLVLVTSRDMLAGLVARDGACRVVLDVLPPGDAVALLRSLIGPRADAEPEAAARLAGLCCCLPLALRVAAELAAARPGMSLAALAGELEGRGRLDALAAGGDQATAVRSVFSWSCRFLSPGAARAFRLAALHPGADFDTCAVAALTGTSQPAAARALAQLTRASLIGQAGRGRYAMHDLLRAYAAELAGQDPPGERSQAVTRLLDHYLHATRRAASILFPADAPAPAGEPAGDVCGLAAGGEQAARAWLHAERANLTAVAAHASEHDWPGHAAGLSAALFRYLNAGGFFTDALVIHNAAARAAIDAGDRAAEAAAVTSIGTVYMTLGPYPKAEQHYQRALGLSRQAGDHPGELRALQNLSHLYLRMGALPQATASCQQALRLSRATGDRIREARVLLILGLIGARQGRYRQAATDLGRAVEAIRAAGDLAFLAIALGDLGEVEVRQGRYRQARRHLQEAGTTARQIGHTMAQIGTTAILGFADLREGRHQQAAQRLQRALAAFHDAGGPNDEARVLCYLGELDLRLGHHAQAAGHYQQAQVIYQRTAEPFREAEARNGLGEAALAQGAPADARAQHETALAIARKIASPVQQARAHEGLGDISAAAGDTAAARLHWQQALTRYAAMDIPDASRIHAKLAATQDAQAPARQPR
jgi:DNA-binding SARP family transcriptional activator/tetratricopeptide (TPR) repeat protein